VLSVTTAGGFYLTSPVFQSYCGLHVSLDGICEVGLSKAGFVDDIRVTQTPSKH